MKPDEKVLLDNIGKISYTLDKAYLSKLTSDYGVLYFEEKYNKKGRVDYSSNIRALKVERWIFDQEQLPGDCFENVLNLFADGDHTVALVVKRKPTHTEMYFARIRAELIEQIGKLKTEYTRDCYGTIER